jgi:aspartate beta-hydroxylase
MKPGTHLRAHCGPSNLRLRVHLGVDVPSAGGWNIRVGDEVRQWREGECLVFDDSWEHEVWHEATPGDAQRMGGPAGPGAGCGADSRARVVLIVDIWHPAIPFPERRGHLPSEQGDKYEAIVRGSGPLEAMTERELSDGSIRRVRGD